MRLDRGIVRRAGRAEPELIRLALREDDMAGVGRSRPGPGSGSELGRALMPVLALVRALHLRNDKRLLGAEVRLLPLQMFAQGLRPFGDVLLRHLALPSQPVERVGLLAGHRITCQLILIDDPDRWARLRTAQLDSFVRDLDRVAA